MSVLIFKKIISTNKKLNKKLDDLNDNLYELIQDMDGFDRFVESEFGCTFKEKITEVRISGNEEGLEELEEILETYEEYLQELQDIRDEYNSDEEL